MQVQSILDLRQRLPMHRQRLCLDSTCLQFSLNLPGNDKFVFPAQPLANLGLDYLHTLLTRERIVYNLCWSNHHQGFFVALFSVACCPFQLKRLLLDAELAQPLSIYWDFDVFTRDDTKLSRTLFNAPARRCFICSQSAKLCALRQTHSNKALLSQVRNDYKAYAEQTSLKV